MPPELRGSLRDRDGILHAALRPNDDDAWWTPIACGQGILMPGTQTDDDPTCATCISAIAMTRKQGPGPT